MALHSDFFLLLERMGAEAIDSGVPGSGEWLRSKIVWCVCVCVDFFANPRFF